MKYLIEYHWIQSDHILATPTFHHKEIVDCDSEEKLNKYISSQKDGWGHLYKKDKSMGFDFISKQGAVKVSIYNPKIKKI